MASVPKGLVLGLCVFAGFVIHGFLTKPPVYERVGENQRFNRFTGETEEKFHNDYKNQRWKVNPGYDLDHKPSNHLLVPEARKPFPYPGG